MRRSTGPSGFYCARRHHVTDQRAPGVVGSVTWLLAVALATLIGQGFDGIIAPLAAGLAGLSVALLLVMRWAEVDREVMVRGS